MLASRGLWRGTLGHGFVNDFDALLMTSGEIAKGIITLLAFLSVVLSTGVDGVKYLLLRRRSK
jgi:hypothetical protein